MSAANRDVKVVGRRAFLIRMASGHRRVSMILRQEHGVAAVEFALTFPIAVGTIVFGLALGYFEAAQELLNDAVRTVGRQVMVGSITSSTQIRGAICRAIPALVDCNQVIFDLTPYSITTISTTPLVTFDSSGSASGTGSVNFGSSHAILVLRFYYQVPIVGGAFLSIADQNNGTKFVAATSVFVKEN